MLEARQNMLGIVDFDDVLSNLEAVGKFIRIAYNGVAGDTELQTSMWQLALEIAQLCDDAGLTVDNFRTTADSVLTDYIGAYHLLFDNMEQMALTAFASVGDSAIEMEKTAQDFCTRFTEKRETVLTVCKSVKDGKGEREKKHCQALVDIHGTTGALANVATIMQKLAIFWKSMQQICRKLSNEKFKALLQTVQKERDQTKRLKAYTSNTVKLSCVKMYVSWVALEWICEEFVQKMKIFRKETYNYICENPTVQESRARINLMCTEFREHIEQADRKIRKK